MVSLVSYILVVFAVVLSIPVTIFVAEILAALASPRGKASPDSNQNLRRRVAIVVPAHNESLNILPTIEDIKAQLRAGDRLLVVADNCSDDTAHVASAAGAETIERFDLTRVGKGYALDFGLKHLSLDPPAIVIVIDADCRIETGAIECLTLDCATTGRPVQALDLMIASDNTVINHRVAEFAWRIKNWVRPLGLRSLNLPCQLMGSGMAFPWHVIRVAKTANSSIVEDLRLGLELTELRSSPTFCPSACVWSKFPLSVEGSKTQRKRWEAGHISLILTTVPHFVYVAIARRNLDLLVLTLDMAIPPLSLLVILLAVMTSVAGIAATFGASSAALLILGACILAFTLAIFLAWLKYGRDILPLSEANAVASYVFAKLPIYRHLLSSRTSSSWIRTDRKKSD